MFMSDFRKDIRLSVEVTDFGMDMPTDLAIEQVVMRSLKTTGGLTQGRGMTELQRTVWLLSTPACPEVNRTLQEVTDVTYEASTPSKRFQRLPKHLTVCDSKKPI